MDEPWVSIAAEDSVQGGPRPVLIVFTLCGFAGPDSFVSTYRVHCIPQLSIKAVLDLLLSLLRWLAAVDLTVLVSFHSASC